MSRVAIVGGSGLTTLPGLVGTGVQVVDTPYGSPSSALSLGQFGSVDIVFLPRHGEGHRLAPHGINYRANMWALSHVGVTEIVAVNAVGGIHPDMGPGAVSIPHNLIDYTWGRSHTFFDGVDGNVQHIDFSEPYDAGLRSRLCVAAEIAGVAIHDFGVYGATQGPRLETAAEIDRMERDGCDLVGMTGMPEAALARELGLAYAVCAVVVNDAAGRGDGGEITMESIRSNLDTGMAVVLRVLKALFTH